MKKSVCFLFLFIFVLSCNKENPDPTDVNRSITLTIQGSGSLNTTSGTYEVGESLTLIATPSDGFYFDRWQGGIISEENPLTFTVTENLNISAVFTPIPELLAGVELYTPKQMDEHPVFVIENGGQLAYLMDKTGTRLTSWEFDSRLGNDLELLPDGSLIGLFKPESTTFSFGGYGGVLKQYDPAGTLVWEYELNTENYLLHHDFAVLPNGNIIVLVWERIASAEATAQGFPRDTDFFTEKVIEIDPTTDTIVWEWRSWEHKVQDLDPDAPNFGNLTTEVQKIDLNYNDNENGDIMHANGIAFDPINDLIYISVNFYSEVWVIDHNLSTAEAQTSLGDLKYRIGNPTAYKGSGERMFYKNHHPNFVTLDPETQGNFMIYMNGAQDEQSVVMEFIIPTTFIDDSGSINEPQLVWSFTDPDLYFDKISGAVRLSNGNTLICEGDYGYWEVTREGDVIWKYNSTDSNVWRGYSYPFYLPSL